MKQVETWLLSYASKPTRETYKKSIEQFIQYWEDTCKIYLEEPSDITHSHIQGYQRYLEQKSGYAAQTIRTKIFAVVSFCNFLFQNGFTKNKISERVRLPKVKMSKTAYDPIPQNDLMELLDQLQYLYFASANPSQCASDFRHWNNYIIFHTMSVMGMRASELTGLKISSLTKLQNGYYKLQVKLKGGATHAPVIPEKTAILLNRYIQICRPDAQPNDSLFIIKFGVNKPICRTYLSRMITSIAKTHNVCENRISAHTLRATVASMLHKNNVPIGQIQELLGHDHIESTMRYVRQSDEIADSAALKNPICL